MCKDRTKGLIYYRETINDNVIFFKMAFGFVCVARQGRLPLLNDLIIL